MRNRELGSRPLRRVVAAVTALSFLLAACAQPLQVAQLDDQKIRVTAFSTARSGVTPNLAAVEKKALWQAARATLDAGHRYFKIVERQREARPAGGYGLGLTDGSSSGYNYLGHHKSGEAALVFAAALLILLTIDLTVYVITYSPASAEVTLVVGIVPSDGQPHAEEGLLDAAAIIQHWPDLTALPSTAARTLPDI